MSSYDLFICIMAGYDGQQDSGLNTVWDSLKRSDLSRPNNYNQLLTIGRLTLLYKCSIIGGWIGDHSFQKTKQANTNSAKELRVKCCAYEFYAQSSNRFGIISSLTPSPYGSEEVKKRALLRHYKGAKVIWSIVNYLRVGRPGGRRQQNPSKHTSRIRGIYGNVS
jgi:hypothetical protein